MCVCVWIERGRERRRVSERGENRGKVFSVRQYLPKLIFISSTANTQCGQYGICSLLSFFLFFFLSFFLFHAMTNTYRLTHKNI